MISADSYEVYVPSAEVEDFRKISGEVAVRTQEELSASYLGLLEAAVSNAHNEARLGWYLQQFHKIEALRQSSDSRLIIWDADCVPVARRELFDQKGLPIFMEATERHAAYFETIRRLFGPIDFQPFSFVIPGFPILGEWASSFVSALESRFPGKTWFEAIISATDLSLKSGFSETETLGTWMAYTYRGSWTSRPVAWERLGQSRFGKASRFSPSDLEELGKKKELEVISFENWDVPLRSSKKSGARSMLTSLGISRFFHALSPEPPKR